MQGRTSGCPRHSHCSVPALGLCPPHAKPWAETKEILEAWPCGGHRVLVGPAGMCAFCTGQWEFFFLSQREPGSKFLHLPSRGMGHFSLGSQFYFCPRSQSGGGWRGPSRARSRHQEASLVKMMPETVPNSSLEAISIPQTAVFSWPGSVEHTVVCSDAQV